jgi:chaperonin GroES
MSKLIPLGARLLVKPTQEKKTTAGGLYIPDTVKELPTTGTIVDMGTGTPDEPMNKVKIGDLVMFGKHAGTEINISNDKGENEPHLIINLRDIYGIIKD